METCHNTWYREVERLREQNYKLEAAVQALGKEIASRINAEIEENDRID